MLCEDEGWVCENHADQPFAGRTLAGVAAQACRVLSVIDRAMKTRRGCREVLMPTREQAEIGFLRVQETAPAGETAEAANLVGLLPEDCGESGSLDRRLSETVVPISLQ
jgi:hypothetical protein